MSKFKTYEVPLPDSLSGTQEFEYRLDDKFFALIRDEDTIKINKGDLLAKITLKQHAGEYEILFDIAGEVKIPCDRCLDDLTVAVETKDRLVVKLGDDYSDESDNIVVIPYSEKSINISWFIFEFIALSLPMKNVHEAGMCNKSMSSKYDKHKVDEAEVDEEDSEEEETDSRWDSLKELGSRADEE